jgi:hypothetical protein
MTEAEDRAAIDAVVRAFFAVFDNRGGKRPRLGALHELCLPECVTTRGSAEGPTTCGLESFIAPRAALLTSGELAEFCEEEVAAHTDIFGGVAQRICVYRKSGVLNGSAFRAQGVKTLQLVKTAAGWKISAFAWEDERPGLEVPAPLSCRVSVSGEPR